MRSCGKHAYQTPSLPNADPRSDRPRCGGRESKFLAFININDKSRKPLGKLHMNGQLKGTIENWDLTFGWDPAQVLLVLGASYVGYMDDLAVFNRALTEAEVKQLFELKNGVRDLHH